MTTTVFIDIDNTLLDFDKCAEMSAQMTFGDMGLRYSDKVFPVFTEINNGLWRDYEEGRITKTEIHKVRWNLIFEKLRIKEDGVECEKLFYSYLRQSSVKITGADELLKYLHSRYTVCAASNSAYEQQKIRLHNAGLLKYIHYLFVSEDIGFKKPEKKFFDVCLKRLGDPDKSEVIIIGDSQNADIRGGRAYGIKTCWYNPFDAADAEGADYIIKNLSEIKNIL